MIYIMSFFRHITTFESAWRFQEGEQIFVHDDNTKRNFIIIRLYCQEKKVYCI
ncbi:hypothetical protein ICG_04782 [Bacillus cereus BAG1X1-3]|nr:hypothetical protein ICG_04782 [Bacillus cereus BAG1X1-3]EOO80709.1 hypothetical protein IC7_05175 [Bacillus cereus BAG1O-1]